jgi:acetolactate synthase-1/2/3 large subunit
MKASDFVARYLEARGVTHTFELVGGMITHLLDSLSRQTGIHIVSCHHEQGAAFAAEGFARITGVPGVALATSGPGATNLLTGIGSCFFDSTPAVFLTGQVNTHELKGERGIRQLGFQETDIVSMARPISKWVVQVSRAEELPAVLKEAFRLALEGRPGPCLVDLPMNVQAESLPEAVAQAALQEAAALGRAAPAPAGTLEPGSPDLTLTFGQLFQAIREAQRPLLLLGGGCAAVPNRSASLQIAEILHLPTVLSLMGVDVLPDCHPLRVGFIGSYGNRWANKVLGRADLLVVVGSRLDIRQTGSDLPSFCAGKQIWQIDIDPAEMGVRLQPHQTICCSIPQAARMLAATDDGRRLNHPRWNQDIADLRRQFPAAREYVAEPGDVNPVALLQELSELISGPCQYITDVGQHQMWAAQSLALASQDRFLTSGGMGAMGFGLPAAIGAALARPDATTVLISGDGGFQVNIQELETVRRNHLPLKILLFNNQCHGMVRQFQETYFVGNLQSTAKRYSAPDFVAVGQAYAIPSSRLPPGADTAAALRALLSRDGPALLDVPLPMTSNVYPKLAFGRPFGDMEPDVAPTAMEST